MNKKMLKDLNRTDWSFEELKNYDFSPFKYYIYSSKFGGAFKGFLPEKIMNKIFTKIEMVSDYCMVKDDYRVMVDEMGYLDVYYFENNSNKISYELLYTGRRDIKLSDVLDSITKHKRALTLETILE